MYVKEILSYQTWIVEIQNDLFEFIANNKLSLVEVHSLSPK